MNVLIDNLDGVLTGFFTTVRLLVFGGLGATIIGLLVATMRISPVASLRGFAVAYTELVRNIPLTLVFFFMTFVLPLIATNLPPYEIRAVIALAIYTSPFIAEALRSGINGVPVGQAEAARSIGLGFGQTLTLIVLPQALRMVVPPLINVFIALTKNTSVAGGFFVLELFGTARILTNNHGNAVIPILVGVACFYLLITIPLGLIAGRIEKKVRVLR
ncbi:amino acid ABC transporter permease [Leucobacter luti]|uniref:Amino acid ABC transporter membrane protein 1 (PAAT family) n=1 Tax=Leucobacter luti TaxID=340320 RepID=A0A4Q7U1W4_9MICO|nr:amino acid ABC transporter permease [Leucobacter luti]MBL3698924.1 amino acid ABC transporter permease [Leucobacter luti]RZT66302.1 amino acid ABC transporter membrane protein 1 (PAAT family) [Leucobacter luti]